MVTLEFAPFMTHLDKIPGTSDEYSGRGIFFDIFEELKKGLNFTYSSKLSPDREFGAKNPNGTWSGMVKALQDELFDICKQNQPLKNR